MKNKDVKPPEEIRLPELEIHGVWARVIDRIRHIRRLYWLIGIVVLLTLFIILIPQYIWIALWSGLKTNGFLSGMLLVFSLVAVSLVWSTGQRIDVWVLMYFNMHGRRAPWLDWVMLAFTQIGNGVLSLLLALIAYFTVNRVLAYEIILGTLTLWLTVEILKFLFNRSRPYIKIKTVRIVGSRASGHSFPSGHTSQAFFIATFLFHYFQVTAFTAVIFYTAALLVGITRIYVGMHYPRDVLGGAILGTSWGFLAVIVNNSIF